MSLVAAQCVHLFVILKSRPRISSEVTSKVTSEVYQEVLKITSFTRL